MQATLQSSYGPTSAGWVWLRDALSVWYAMRGEGSASAPLSAGHPLDDLHGNRAAGVHFVSFLEESYGPSFIRALVGCDGAEPWTVIAGLAHTSKGSLFIRFYSWAARQGILADGTIGNSTAMERMELD